MSYSRRQLEAFGEPFGESATRVKPGGHGRIYGGGGGGAPTQTTSTSYQTNIPEYAEPYVHTMLGATQKQLFNMDGNEVTGFKPYTPYSTNAADYVAPFSPMQEQSFRGVSQLGPSQLGEMGGQMAGAATMGALGTGYDPYRMGQFTSGRAAQYMNPFVEQAMEPQLREAQRSSEMQRVADQAQATRAGAFGGSRQAIVEAERQRNLGIQQGDIRAKGYMSAFDQAQQQFGREQQLREQSRQYGAGLGLQGLQTALQGAGQMGQLGQTQFGQRQATIGMQQQFGALQQAQEQQKINQAIQDYANAQQYPLMQLGVMSNMLRGLPMQAATTNQYVAPPNALTQGIGAAGSYAALQNAGVFGKPGGAAGGLPSEFKYAEGGIASVPRYDVGGEVESQLESMDSGSLAKQAQESSSPTIRRMAQRILRERQMERGADQSAAPTGPMGVDYQAAQGMASGGIIAFQQGKTVTDPDRLAAQTAAYVTGAQEAARLRREQEPVQETDFMFSEGPARPSITRGLQTLGRGISQAVARPAAPRLQFDSEDQAAAPAPEARSAPAPEARPAQAAQPAAAPAPAPAPAPARPAPARPAPARPAAAPASEGITQAPPRGVGEGRLGSVEAEGAAPAYTGALADIQRMVAAAGAEAGRTEDSFLADVKRGQPENVAAAEYRKQIMEERANAKGEAERQRHMRTAEFFARWGSTPGPTLAAGLKALEKSIPDMLSDEKEQKKARRELDKVQFDIDNSIRLEERGDMKEARALKEKARDRFMNLNERYAQILGAQQTAETSASASRYAADLRLKGDKITAAASDRARAQRAGETADDKKYQRLQVSRDQENRVLNQIATEKDKEVHKADLRTAALREDGKVPAGMEQRVADAQRRIAEREADWDRRSKAAAGSVDEARRRVTGETAPAPAAAPAAAPAPATTAVSRADIEATARASGKTVAEVEAAARAKGYTIK